MLPHVILHNEVSLDGRMDWISPDLGRFHALAARLGAHATLAGCDTLLAATAGAPEDPSGPPVRAAAAEAAPGGPDARPLLVVPDSRGRFRRWAHLLGSGLWRGAVALCSRSTPAERVAELGRLGVKTLVTGQDRVDLREALERLAAEDGVRRVRVDAGGSLNGVLLRAGLVSEVSLLLEPLLVGGLSPRTLFRAEDLASREGRIRLELLHSEQLEDGTVWLRYAVIRDDRPNPVRRARP